MTNFMTRARRTAGALLVAAAGLAPLPGCSSDKLLSAKDPDLINPANIESPEGADALANGAIGRFSNAVANLESMWLFGGMLADEWSSTSTFTQNDETDQRTIQESNASVTTQYRNLHRVRTAANQAIRALAQFRPTFKADISEMLLARGYAEMQLGESFCNGQPFSEIGPNLEQILGPALTTTEVFDKAIATFDSAITVASEVTAGAPASEVTARARILNAAKIGKARSLRNNARFAEAAAAVVGVARGFKYDLTHAQANNNDNVIWSQNVSVRRYTIGDSVEGNARNILVQNALPFYSANDPRVRGKYTTTAKTGGGLDTTKSQDGLTYSRTLLNIYENRDRPATVFSGLDAELIRAEERLNATDYPGMIAILNSLRGDASVFPPGTPAGTTLPQTLVPQATAQANTDLYFREKAFWTFGRGQRLGDLRRLLRPPYSRNQDQVFPVGAFFKGGNYGTDVNFPVPQAELNNPNFHGCIDRTT